MWTYSCEGSEGSALGDTLTKALLISWISITLYYFRIVRTCCSLLILSYFLVFGTSCMSTNQHRIEQRGPTLVGHVHGPGSWEDLA